MPCCSSTWRGASKNPSQIFPLTLSTTSDFILLYSSHMGSLMTFLWMHSARRLYFNQPAALMPHFQLYWMQMSTLSKCTRFTESVLRQHCILEQEQAQTQPRPFPRMQQGAAKLSPGNGLENVHRILLHKRLEAQWWANPQNGKNSIRSRASCRKAGNQSLGGKATVLRVIYSSSSFH